MAVRILHWIALAACVALIIACFLPWGYYADLQETFTGFYSHANMYGKPGKLLSAIALVVLLLMLLPKVWAKRANLFLSALAVGYAVKTYILFTACYKAYCPEKRAGIFIMMAAVIIMLLGAIFPDLTLTKKKED